MKILYTLFLLTALPFMGFAQNLITNSNFMDASDWSEQSAEPGPTCLDTDPQTH